MRNSPSSNGKSLVMEVKSNNLLRTTSKFESNVINLNWSAHPSPSRRPPRPRRRLQPARYRPNPRLYRYPSPSKLKPKKPARGAARRQRRRVRRRAAPSARLYRPPPPRTFARRPPPPPPARPLLAWKPPPPRAPCDTASRAALRLTEQREFSTPHCIKRVSLSPESILLHKRPLAQRSRRQRRLKSSRCQPPVRRPSPRKPYSPVYSQPSARRPPPIATRSKAYSQPSVQRTPLGNSRLIAPSQSLVRRPPPFIPRSIVRGQLPVQKTPPRTLRSTVGSKRPLRDSPFHSQPARCSSLSPHKLPISTIPAPTPLPYRPLSYHFRVRSLETDSGSTSPVAARLHRPPAEPSLTTSSADGSMAAPWTSHTPEDGSDGNDSTSAPSEFLAEFLSAIMQRQYGEALKYCRLILQYEPHNATARSFHPLLQHKLGLVNISSERSSSEASCSAGVGTAAGSSESDSCASLSLDSSPHSSRSNSPAPPRTLSSSRASGGSTSGSSGSEPRAASTASPATDDNGNPRAASRTGDDIDVENDNAAGGDHTSPLLKDASLQQLRAQFACSIK